jgi:hypothetical protein
MCHRRHFQKSPVGTGLGKVKNCFQGLRRTVGRRQKKGHSCSFCVHRNTYFSRTLPIYAISIISSFLHPNLPTRSSSTMHIMTHVEGLDLSSMIHYAVPKRGIRGFTSLPRPMWPPKGWSEAEPRGRSHGPREGVKPRSRVKGAV